MTHRLNLYEGDDGRAHWACLCGTGWGKKDTEEQARGAYAVHVAGGLGGGTGDFLGQPGVDLPRWSQLRHAQPVTLLAQETNPVL